MQHHIIMMALAGFLVGCSELGEGAANPAQRGAALLTEASVTSTDTGTWTVPCDDSDSDSDSDSDDECDDDEDDHSDDDSD